MKDHPTATYADVARARARIKQLRQEKDKLKLRLWMAQTHASNLEAELKTLRRIHNLPR